MVSLILVFESLRYFLLCDIGSAAHDLLSFRATTLHLLPKYKVKQWLEIYSRIYGNDKSRNSANEGGADPYGLQIICPRKAWESSALA
jgi:hypothetical protein